MLDRQNSKIALVTGANRGLGFETSRQLAKAGHRVLMGCRDISKSEQACSVLQKENLQVELLELDVTRTDSIRRARDRILTQYGFLDILVNNAGGNYDYDQLVTEVDPSFVRETFELNLFSVWTIIQEFLPLLHKSSSARIVNVSSGAGSFSDRRFGLSKNEGAISAYGLAKLALNGLTVKFSMALQNTPIIVNSVCPGFTATTPDWAAFGARPVEEGAAGIVWAALLPDDGPRGGFFRDGQPIDWVKKRP